jgi:hypothetical protein
MICVFMSLVNNEKRHPVAIPEMPLRTLEFIQGMAARLPFQFAFIRRRKFFLGPFGGFPFPDIGMYSLFRGKVRRNR